MPSLSHKSTMSFSTLLVSASILASLSTSLFVIVTIPKCYKESPHASVHTPLSVFSTQYGSSSSYVSILLSNTLIPYISTNELFF